MVMNNSTNVLLHIMKAFTDVVQLILGCGDLPQFDTPEYTKFSSIQRTKWETSEGIDPYTYGYNRRTKDEEYRSVKTILHTLIDIVSKNGNYLLNLGPTAEGVIIKPMVDRLLEVGKWLKHSGECIYGTVCGWKLEKLFNGWLPTIFDSGLFLLGCGIWTT